MPKVKDFMSKDIVSVSSDARLNDAARLMKQHDVGVLPVCDGNKLRGVVTDRDIVVKGLAEGRAGGHVSDVMTRDVVTLSPDDDDKKAQQLMSDNDVRRLPVCDNNEIVGMVSVGDLAVRTDEKRAGEVMEKTGPSS
jgi:CBS domain-containing protein